MNKFITQQQILNFIFVWKQFLWNNYILKSTYIYIFFFFLLPRECVADATRQCDVPSRKRETCVYARARALPQKKKKKERNGI